MSVGVTDIYIRRKGNLKNTCNFIFMVIKAWNIGHSDKHTNKLQVQTSLLTTAPITSIALYPDLNRPTLKTMSFHCIYYICISLSIETIKHHLYK